MAEFGLKQSVGPAIKRAARAEKLIILLLLFILLTTAMATVSAVLTGPDWALLWESLLLGLLVGWVLAIFRWPAWRAALMVIFLGLAFTLLFVAGIKTNILAVLSEAFRLIGMVIASFKIKGIDFSPIANQAGQLYTATIVVVGRVYLWVRELMFGQATFDPVAAGIVWNIVVWMVAAWAGWVVEAHRNALVAVLPVLALNLSTLSYGRSNSTSIYFLLGLTLVLVAVVQYNRYEQLWDDTRVAYPTRKSREIGQIALGLAVLLVVISAIVASNSLAHIIQRATTPRPSSGQPESGLAKSLGIVPAATPTPDVFTTLRSPGLPRELLIGAGPELSREQVMAVNVSDLGALQQNNRLPPLYWRSFTYDIYTGHGWSSSPTLQTQHQAGQPIGPSQLPWHALVQQGVSFVPGQGGAIYAAGEPVTADVANNAAYRSSDDLFGIAVASPSYKVQSLLPVVSEDTLRQAGQAYPKWVTQRYLAVPDELPPRVTQLALQLTTTQPTPYDRAHAIEQYLRGYPYTLDVPLPPANQDLVDYFLFDLRKGYCDYYASAMVILARAAGIPARLAVGYATGTYNEKSNRFIVTEADAHSWVEVYFPGIGWVTFEPTAGLPAINRSAQPATAATAAASPPLSPPTVKTQIGGGSVIGYIVLPSIIIAGMAWVIWDEIHLQRRPPRLVATEVYRRLRRYSETLGLPRVSGETPYEFSESLIGHIISITTAGYLSGAGQKVIDETNSIINEIVQLSYQPAVKNSAAVGQLIDDWRALRWRLRWLWLINRWVAFRQVLGYVIKGHPSQTDAPQG